ncbi:flagellar basal body P-ring formation chaperone FlgA [Massilia sp. TSP1-1-2]|uniref:flagellar basal body P-ring formation chaperone FlgA n=1 Tax=Massilia sp. TSP1-1-2 TaxID=2804649 RepID=UPI003CF18C9F
MPLNTATLLAAFAALPLQASAQPVADADPVLELRQDALVTHRRITLSDVAQVHAASAQAQALGAIPLGRAPLVGQMERLTRVQIEQAIRRHSTTAASLKWQGAASVAVRTQAQTVAAQDISQAALAAARAQYGTAGATLDVALAAPLTDYEVPVGVVTVKARPVPAPVGDAGSTSVWVDLFVEGELYRTVAVQLVVTLRRQSYVARHAIAPGATASAQDFMLGETDGASGPVVSADQPLLPFRAARGIRAGQPLTPASMLAGGSVLRGDSVKLQMRAGQIGIDMAGVAMNDALPGQMLSVRPVGARDLVTGRVSQSGAVVIE